MLIYLGHFIALTVSRSQPSARILIQMIDSISAFNVILINISHHWDGASNWNRQQNIPGRSGQCHGIMWDRQVLSCVKPTSDQYWESCNWQTNICLSLKQFNMQRGKIFPWLKAPYIYIYIYIGYGLLARSPAEKEQYLKLYMSP